MNEGWQANKQVRRDLKVKCTRNQEEHIGISVRLRFAKCQVLQK